MKVTTRLSNVCESCGSVLHEAKPGRLDEVPGSEHIKRAIEVALTGRHSIALLSDREAYGHAEALASYAASYGLVVWLEMRCPCGGFTSQAIACTCSNGQIVRHQASTHFYNAMAADIIVEAVAPRAEIVVSFASGRRGEPDEIILARSDYAQGVEVSDELDDTTRRLLRSAISQSYISQDRVNGLKAVATSIAKLAGSNMIQPAHMAEALQYMPRPEFRPAVQSDVIPSNA